MHWLEQGLPAAQPYVGRTTIVRPIASLRNLPDSIPCVIGRNFVPAYISRTGGSMVSNEQINTTAQISKMEETEQKRLNIYL